MKRNCADDIVDAADDDVVTSSQSAARLLAEHLDTGSAVLVVGTEALCDEVEKVGLRAVRRFVDAPVAVVGSRNAITPAAELEEEFFPQPAWLLDAIHERIWPLPGHVCTTNQTEAELARRARLGL